MPEVIDLRATPAGSPEWWLARLLARLDARRPDLETFEAYYDGHQPLAFASQSSGTPSGPASASSARTS
jgi:hypothetical protein